MDLIGAYYQKHPELSRFHDLGRKKRQGFSGSYYFGEHLSEGSLRVEGKIRMVSVQALIDEGLFTLLPQLKESVMDAAADLAKEVVRLREPFYEPKTPSQCLPKDELQVAMDIAKLFEGHWEVPMAVSLISLMPRRGDDGLALHVLATAALKGLTFSVFFLHFRYTGAV